MSDGLILPEVNINSLRYFLISKIPFVTKAFQTIDIVILDDTKPGIPNSIGFTDGVRVYVNARKYAEAGQYSLKTNHPWFKTPELGYGFILLHELGHIILDSFGRIHGRDRKIWNSATDYVINQFILSLMRESNLFSSNESYTQILDLVEQHFLFKPVLYSTMSAEQVYDDIYTKEDEEGNGPLADDLVYDVPNESSEEKMLRDIITQEMSDYVAKNADKLPVSGGREFSILLEPPKVDLRTVLRRISDRTLKEDWGYPSRGSRIDHLMPKGIRLPDMVDLDPDRIKMILFVLDSSGSLSSKQLNDAINIVRECFNKHTRSPVYLIVHTHHIKVSMLIKDYIDVPTNISGGTNFGCVIQEIERLRTEKNIEPSVILWLTDLYGEINPTSRDMKNTCKNPSRQLKWLISGSREVPNCGTTFYLDTI